jgi:hypothetical protein
VSKHIMVKFVQFCFYCFPVCYSIYRYLSFLFPQRDKKDQIQIVSTYEVFSFELGPGWLNELGSWLT